MSERRPDYEIVSGGGSIADLSGFEIEDPDKLIADFLEVLRDPQRDALAGEGLAYRLMKDGAVWDYSNHLADIEKWTLKILAEEPDAAVSVDLASREEWYSWRTGERWSE